MLGEGGDAVSMAGKAVHAVQHGYGLFILGPGAELSSRILERGADCTVYISKRLHSCATGFSRFTMAKNDKDGLGGIAVLTTLSYTQHSGGKPLLERLSK